MTILALALATGAMSSVASGQLPAVSGPLQHARGQNIAPVYEGWYRGPDGTIHVSFGYLNKNYEEAIDVPIGPGNKVEPGPADQGQPTHFLPRRHWGAFVVALPKDHPKTEVTWTLTVRGRTESVPANLSDVYIIDALSHIGGTEEGSTPPLLRFDDNGASAFGPAGLAKSVGGAVGRPLPLTVWVDEARSSPGAAPGPGSPRAGAKSPFNVIWSLYRGPGGVTFDNARPAVQNGTATTQARFAAPGDYTLRVVAVRGTSFSSQCCWTNGYLRVKVESGP